MVMFPQQGPKLRDIHVPEPGWWPLAPGWWMLAISVLLMSGLLVWWLRRHFRQKHVMRQIEAEVSRLVTGFEHDNDHSALAAGLTQLLRRAVLFRGGKASLEGTAWQQQLDQLAPGILDEQHLQVLATAPYQRKPRYPADALVDSCRRWLQRALVKHGA